MHFNPRVEWVKDLQSSLASLQRLQLSRFGREISRFEANFQNLPLEFDFLPLKLCWKK